MVRQRIPQLILLAVAGDELRGLLTAIAHAVSLFTAGSTTLLCSGALVALGLGFVLLQIARGLNRVATVPRWVLCAVGAGCILASVLLVLISAEAVVGGHRVPSTSLGRDGPWPDARTLLGFGFAAPAVWEGGCWLARHGLTFAIGFVSVPARDLAGRTTLRTERLPGSTPGRAGWSDRGPPRRLSPQAI